MSADKHTPGPWRIVDLPDDFDPEDGEELEIASCEDFQPSFFIPIASVSEQGESTVANARLIAAAPVMLTALQSARAYIQADHDHLLKDFCLTGDDGCPDPTTMDADEARFVAEAQQELDRIDAALKAAGVVL